MCYRDRTYCISPNCKGECGKKLTDEERKRAEKSKLPISYAYFCGEPKDE